MKSEEFILKLSGWYHLHHRELPWRDTHDPYVIWLSEIILQQTRVAQGLPYFHKFLDTYPNLETLAKANEKEVLRLWQGLGYYSRARNMLSCAREVQESYGGKFPEEYEQLKKLKGVGPYTAAAIASFAFEKPVPALDGNVFRVISRIFGLSYDILSTRGRKIFFEKVSQLISKKNPGEFNQALMEFGAIQCTPHQPNCGSCPFSGDCFAFQNDAQQKLPVKSSSKKSRDRYFHYFVIYNDEGFLMRPRSGNDIWRGLYDFYLLEKDKYYDPDEMSDDGMLLSLKRSRCTITSETRSYKHQLSHQRIFASFFLVKIPHFEDLQPLLDENSLQAFTPYEIQDLPKPILIHNFLKDQLF